MKFSTLALTIYRHRNLQLAVTIAEIVENVLENANNKNHVLWKTKMLEKKFTNICQLTYWKIHRKIRLENSTSDDIFMLSFQLCFLINCVVRKHEEVFLIFVKIT